jgi:two-component system, sensor histidine kinase
MFKSVAAWWFTPRTTEPNLIFREKTGRALIAVTLVLVVASLFTSLLLFNAPWKLVSYPTAELVAGALLVASFIALQRRQVTTAGYILVAAFMWFSAFIPLVDTATGTSSVNYYVISLVIVALVLPRKAIFLVAGLSAVLSGASLLLTGTAPSVAYGRIADSSIILATLSVLLYLLRAEFDNRLLAAEAARRETEQALLVTQAARVEAERANQAKSNFLSIMSHELRTPLGAIIGFVGILHSGMIKDKAEALPLSNTQKDMLKQIRMNADHLLNLINSILDLAKVSSGRIHPNLAVTNPCDESFIIGTVNGLRSLAINKGIDLELQLAPDLPAEVECDTLQIKQVVKNLVGNAIKFTERGKVSVGVSKNGDQTWQIVVRDSGIGIKPEQLGHIFDPFYQADSTDTRAREGTGLGLAIAKSYVELHGGSIQANSTVGVGTTFTVHIPCKPQRNT